MNARNRVKSEDASSRPHAVASGELFDGLADCYVLEDGRRILSQRGVLRGLRGRNGDGAKDGGLGRLLARLPNGYESLALEPVVEFVLPDGGVALGREGQFFVDLCRAYADLLVAGKLRKDQVHLGRNAYAVLSALAKIGIEELIDEATGYRRTPAERSRARRFAELLNHEAAKWEERFPASLVRALAPLYGIQYLSGSYPRALWGPFGRIYEMVFGGDVAGELRRRNPNRDAFNHHQFLKPMGARTLTNELAIVELLAAQSRTKSEFWSRMRAHYRGEPLQTSFA